MNSPSRRVREALSGRIVSIEVSGANQRSVVALFDDDGPARHGHRRRPSPEPRTCRPTRRRPRHGSSMEASAPEIGPSAARTAEPRSVISWGMGDPVRRCRTEAGGLQAGRRRFEPVTAHRLKANNGGASGHALAVPGGSVWCDGSAMEARWNLSDPWLSRRDRWDH